MKYDYLIVGAGLYGSVFAHEAKKAGRSVIVVDKRDHIGGNIYTEEVEGINVHKYGAHIFHTDKKEVWDHIGQFCRFNDYRHKVIADYEGKIYDLPFNMNTFRQMWGVDTVEEAKAIIDEQRKGIGEIRNLEDQCISMVGSDIYHKLVQGYTEKQWGRDCLELPAFIIRRLPVRFEFNSDYFSDPYQGIPIGGYTKIIEKMLENIEVRLDYDFLKQRREIDYEKLVYSGPIDAFFDYRLGSLEYRSVRFQNEILNKKHFQHNSVVNYTGKDVPYTRIIEHKYFEFGEQEKTVISREYSEEWRPGKEAYYPINDDKNMTLYRKYRELAADLPDVIIGGRLGDYRYYDMDEVVYNALEAWRTRSNS